MSNAASQRDGNSYSNSYSNSDSDTDTDNSTTDSSKDFDPICQPRSLAALAERDRQREHTHQQQQLRQHVNNSNNNTTTINMGDRHSGSAGQASRAKIVGESVSYNQHQQQQQQQSSSFDVVDSVNVNGCHIIALNAKKTSTGGDSDSVDRRANMSKAKNSVASVQSSPREYALTPVVDKKPKAGGFLSRFTGFRFSLRGSKKKQKGFENNSPTIGENVVMVTKSAEPKVNTSGCRSEAGSYQRNSMRSNDFVYIPLKDPLTGKVVSPDNNNVSHTVSVAGVPNRSGSSTPHGSTINSNSVVNNSVEKKHVLTSKPPLPRLPPRVVGVCAKQPNSQASPAAVSPNSKGVTAQRHAQRASSAPREINASDIYHLATANDDDDDFYQQFRLGRRMKQSGGGTGPSDGAILRADPNESTFTDEDGNLTSGADYKIGLIETNLDTHETVISGKTRSLMELGPQQLSIRGAQNNAGRRTVIGATNKTGCSVEPRRPHKSMEFLLDKENQKFVLVSKMDLFTIFYV